MALLVAVGACSKPSSDPVAGLVPSAQFVTSIDGGEQAHSISVVLDQQPAGHRSLLAVSATEITRDGTPERFAQPNVACPNQLVAGCLITNCTSLRGVSSYPYGTVAQVAFGTLTVKGGGHTETLVGDGGTQVIPATNLIFTPGEVLKIDAAKAATPSFRRSLVVPRPVALIVPQVETAGSPITIVRNTPFEVKWSPLPAGAPERIAIAVSDNVRTATCRFDATTGVASVPTEVLSMLAAGPGFLTVHTLWAHDEPTDGWLVSVFARHVATQIDGGTANFPTLEIE